MHRLAAGNVSLDSSVIVDFYLVGRLALLEEMFSGRLLMSDFVKQELVDAGLQIAGVETISLSTVEEWEFFRKLQQGRPGLGPGELGALCVARFHDATLVTNDRQGLQDCLHIFLRIRGENLQPRASMTACQATRPSK